MNNREKTILIKQECFEHFQALDVPVDDIKDMVIDRLANLLVLERDISEGERLERRMRY